MSDNPRNQNEEEISLLDLFTVVLRYRKLIIGIIVFSIILSIAGYYIIPLYQYNKAKKNLQTQGIMQLEIAKKAQGYVSQSMDNFILHPEVIYNSLYSAGKKYFLYGGGSVPLDDKNKTTVMYLINLFWIQNLDFNGNILVQKESNRIFNVKRRDQIVEVTLKDIDTEMIKKFMENIFISCKQNVENNMRNSAIMMVSNYERLLNSPKKSESVQMMLERDFDTYVYLSNFLEGKEDVVKLASKPVFAETPTSIIIFQKQYPRKGVFIAFAGIILAFMLAFLLNTIRNIKNDEDSMKKITEALENSGEK